MQGQRASWQTMTEYPLRLDTPLPKGENASREAGGLRIRPGAAPSFTVPPGQGFFSRIAEFLTEHPAKLPRAIGPAAFSSTRFGGGFLDNLKESFRATPAGARHIHSPMMVDWKPWYRAVWENLRDTLAPPKLPPLQVTSKPVAVKNIWSKNEYAARTQTLSLLAHVAAVLIMSLTFLWKLLPDPDVVRKVQASVVPVDISPYLSKLPAGGKRAGGGGGGGERSETPASRGKAPKFTMQQFARPMVVVRNQNPKLAMDPTLLGPPDLRIASPSLPNYGDPLAAILTNSSGTGSGSGIGSGSGGGIGSGTGGGLGPGEGGGTGGGIFQAGRGGVGLPECIYCPAPVFSDEAVKAKYQGPVTLKITVLADGRVTNVTVVQSPGLGLDEKAIEAVRKWKFRPATGANGKPVSVYAHIEVSFRLL